MSQERGRCLILTKLVDRKVATFEEVNAAIRDYNGYKFWIRKNGSKCDLIDYASGMPIVFGRKTVAECIKYLEDVYPRLENTFTNNFYRSVVCLANEYRNDHDIPTYEL